MPKIDDDYLKCVAFVGSRTVDGQYQLRGTAFFIGLRMHETSPAKVDDVYWVTAKHVIEGIKKLGCTEVHIRVNLSSGGSEWIATPINHWHSASDDDSCDVSILRKGLDDKLDHLVIKPAYFLTEDIQKRYSFDIGDEVFVIGLFRHHEGNKKNVPIARVGNISSRFKGELVETRLGPMEAHLIECRSIGGLSGSPVFVRLGIDRLLKIEKFEKGDVGVFLLGLIHGHFDSSQGEIDAYEAESSLSKEKINTGIAIVTPFEKLHSLMSTYNDTKPSPHTEIMKFEMNRVPELSVESRDHLVKEKELLFVKPLK